MYAHDKVSLALTLFVALVTIAFDPIIGILVGTVMALLVFVEKLSRGQFELVVNNDDKQIVEKIVDERLPKGDQHADTLVYSIKGLFAYVNAAAHVARFEEELHDFRAVVLRLRELSYIDLDGVDALAEIVDLLQAQGKTVYVTGVNPLVERLLAGQKVYRDLEAGGRVLPRTTDALRQLGYTVG
jgi:MFS superfamily sulfate permease-like transporter